MVSFYKSGSRLSLAVFVSLIVDLLAFTLILPLIPSILDYYEIHDKSGLYLFLDSKVRSFQSYIGAPTEYNKVLFGGFLGSWFSFLQFLCTPFIGSFSDVYGRRTALILSLTGIFLSYCVWAMSSASFLLFIISRTIGGLSKGNISLFIAVLTDISKEEERGKKLALVGISFSVGFIFGPMIGAGFSHYQKVSDVSQSDFFAYPAVCGCALSLFNLIFVSSFLPETLDKKSRAKSIGQGFSKAYDYVNPSKLFSFDLVQHLSENDCQNLIAIGRIYFLYLFLYSGLEYTLSFLTHIRFGYTRMQQAKFYLYTGITMTLVQIGYVRRLKRGKEINSAMIGLFLIVISFIYTGLSTTVSGFYFSLLFYSYSSATVVPCLTTIASGMGPNDQKGTVLGIFRSLGSLSRSLGPIVSSFCFWKFGPCTSYCCGGLLLIIPLILSMPLRRRLMSVGKVYG